MTMPPSSRYTETGGIAALLTVVIIGAATLVIASGAAFLGLGELDMGYTSARGAEAFSVADGCLEETLERIRRNASYGIDEIPVNLIVPNGSCVIQIEFDPGSPLDRGITVLGTTGTGNFSKKIHATLALTGNRVTMTSWEERSD